KDWTPRQTSAAILAGVGVCALLVQPSITHMLAGSRFWAGLSQAGLSAIGLACILIGLYRFATQGKK
ncbi:MAG TPA: hypothetical protein VFV74_06750, partial [Burkholderiales bacterium]|nr:hypothetical protein [Burkholderiales bacterium]